MADTVPASGAWPGDDTTLQFLSAADLPAGTDIGTFHVPGATQGLDPVAGLVVEFTSVPADFQGYVPDITPAAGQETPFAASVTGNSDMAVITFVPHSVMGGS